MAFYLLYIDPGSGSLLFQIIIAGVLGLFYFFRTFFEKIKAITFLASNSLTRALQTKGVHPFLILLFFFLYKTKEVLILFRFSELAIFLISAITITSLLFFLFFLITKNIDKSAAILSVFLITVLFYELIYKYLLQISFIQNTFPNVGYLIVFIFFSIASLIWLSKKKFPPVNSYLNILFTVLILIEGITATYNHFKNRQFEYLLDKKNSEKLKNTNSETPVIYHILLDAYTSSSSLKKYWEYDNSELENFLRSNGFYIAEKAQSNSTSTQQSMATTFNMDYQPNLDSIFNSDILSTSVYRNYINHSKIIKILTSKNYSLINLSIFNIGDSAMLNRSGLLPDGTNLLQVLADNTRFASIIKTPPYLDFKMSLAVFEHLKKLPAIIGRDKTFIYAHVNMPHDSYCDSNGNLFTDSYRGNEKQKYIETLTYTNKLLIGTIKKIISESKTPPVIIIHGDHGSRLFDKNEHYSVLSAYYFPDRDYRMLNDSTSLVNSYRIICNKYFKENFCLLPYKRY